jgi:hypothetical protein
VDRSSTESPPASLRSRRRSSDHRRGLKLWRESEPEAPDGPWYKDFGSFKICAVRRQDLIPLLDAGPSSHHGPGHAEGGTSQDSNRRSPPNPPRLRREPRMAAGRSGPLVMAGVVLVWTAGSSLAGSPGQRSRSSSFGAIVRVGSRAVRRGTAYVLVRSLVAALGSAPSRPPNLLNICFT